MRNREAYDGENLVGKSAGLATKEGAEREEEMSHCIICIGLAQVSSYQFPVVASVVTNIRPDNALAQMFVRLFTNVARRMLSRLPKAINDNIAAVNR